MTVNRWRSALSVLPTLCLLMGCVDGSPRPREPRPNLILISLDTLRADRLGSYGYRARDTSPNLDRLAAEGALFEVHVAASPWTTPSHLSIFTSLTPASHGVLAPFRELAVAMTRGEGIPTLPSGYPTIATTLEEAGYRTAAFTGGGTMAPELGFGRGFERYETDMVKIGDAALREMLEWISEPDERPFFLFWHTFEVHAPYLDARFLRRERPSDAARLETGLESMTRALAESGGGEIGETQSAVAGLVRLLEEQGLWSREVVETLYDGGVASADEAVGRVLDHLRRQGLDTDTVVVVTSDHGEELDEHSGLFYDAHGHTVYEELVRVPLLLRFPGRVPPGARIGRQTRSIDLLPTILELLGVPGDQEAMEGRSLVPWIDGPPSDQAQPGFAVSEALADAWEAKSVRTEDYKYVAWIAPEQVAADGRGSVPNRPARRELYHLPTDPGELRNLLAGRGLASPEARAAARELAGYLSRRPVAPLATESRPVTDAELERLRALGYVGDE